MKLFLKIFQGLFLLLLTGILCGAALLGTAALKWSQELPDLSQLDAYEFESTSQIYANNGDLIGEILPIEDIGGSTTDRIPVSLNQVSPAALQAIVSSEDDQFFKHYGFDIPAIVKAFYLLAKGDGGRGGSTITTQVIKNTVLAEIATAQSIERKAKELMLAVELERRLTKTEILQRYINVVYWGGNYYGIRGAAKAYFDKDPIELSLAEGLYLSRLIPAPSSNYEDFLETRTAMRNVLDNMVNQNIISEDTARIAWEEQITPRGWNVSYNADGTLASDPIRTEETLEYTTSVSSSLAPHITWAVRNELTERFGQDRVFSQGGLRVFTTIDPEMQRAANEASRLAQVPPGAEVAIVGLNPETGEVYAMIGEKINDGEPIEEYNRAVAALRQPGSSFKPIVYGAAIEQGGFTQADVMRDEETSFQQPDGLPAWEPGNHDNTFIGLGSLRHHLNISRNIPVAKLVEALTPEVVANRARQLGYETIQPYLSLSLGAFEITPLKHASALGAYANGGQHVEPYVIARVEDADGNILYEASPQRRQVWSPETAYIMLDMMHGNVTDLDRGVTSFSSRAKIEGRYVAGKTGTTNDEKDIWFVGMTPGIVSAVWIGYDDPQPIPKRMPNNDRVTSSRQPIWIWHDFVSEAVKDRDFPTEYTKPENIDFAWFDVVTGTPRGAGASGAVPGAFLRGTGPSGGGAATVRKEITVSIPIDTRTGTRANETTPPESVEWRAVRPGDVESYY